MVKNWQNVEQIFQNIGISYELRNLFYLCDIQGRQFYYSPQTGKWRIKGKRVWQSSQSPEDFIDKAKVYSPPETKYHSTQRQSSNQKSEKDSESKKNRYTSNSSNQKRKTGKVDEIRSEFIIQFAEYLQQQRKKGYKVGWIWYSLLDQFVPTVKEICWLCVVFKYSSWWAYHQVKDLYGRANKRQIFTIIEENRDNWLKFFESHWGMKEDDQYQKEKRTNRMNNPTGYNFIYRGYLKILKLNFPFTKQELKRAYRKRALETHPDSGGKAEVFREVHAAYQVLLQNH